MDPIGFDPAFLPIIGIGLVLYPLMYLIQRRRRGRGGDDGD